LIDARYHEPLDVAAGARAAGASAAPFRRRFAREFGTSPHRYLLGRRIERAQHLLRTTSTSVLGVGLAVGFESASSFSTAFKRVTGVTPSAYRLEAAPERHAEVPTCFLMAWTRPVLHVSRNGKDGPARDG
jgi:transcriptional regulator GlxA family with amidase domain